MLASRDFINLWERGVGLHHLDLGLLLLSAALPDMSCEMLGDWPLGQRNIALTEAQCAWFGSDLRGLTACPQCNEKLEFEMDGSALLKNGAKPGDPITVKGHVFRLPTTRDLAQVALQTDARLAGLQLVENCRMSGGEAIDWPDEDLSEIGERMASADPMAEIRLNFVCARCNHHWDETLDIVAFLWVGVEARAKRLLLEIHTLALAYGWTEPQIFSLSDQRRRTYLDMVRG